ncbi:hypothetical protein ACHAW5_010500 [Stephanodiscus triporus]|uniref:AP2/ERF domain-containing protein n=1 Tax=Stephanodiscus triporus TaxID=2934178 RepID=A0ABD3MZS1_9STRA
MTTGEEDGAPPERRRGFDGLLPPLLSAMEAMRNARLASLENAAGRQTPSFLKKDNTLPWFHAPAASIGNGGGGGGGGIAGVEGGGGGGGGEGRGGGASSPVAPTVATTVIPPDEMTVGRSIDGIRDLREDRIDSAATVAVGVRERAYEGDADGGVSGGDKDRSTPDDERGATMFDVNPRAGEKGVVGGDDEKRKKKKKRKRREGGGETAVDDNVDAAVVGTTKATQGSGDDAAAGVDPTTTAASPRRTPVDPSPLLPSSSSDVVGPTARVATRSPRAAADDYDAVSAAPSHPSSGDVIARATRLGHLVLDQSRGAARRGDQRREFRIDSALSRIDSIVGRRGPSDFGGGGGTAPKATNSSLATPAHALPPLAPKSFLNMDSDGPTRIENNACAYDAGSLASSAISPSKKPLEDSEWSESCLPRLLDVLSKGSGHAVVHDMRWSDRAIRVADLLRNMASSPLTSNRPPSTTREPYPNYGPHLIVTSSGEDFEKYAAVFDQLGCGLLESIFRKGNGHDSLAPASDNDASLRVLPYHGSKVERRQLRKHFVSLASSPESHFSFLGGLPGSPFHVILTTYSELMEDYPHFCQIPLQVVVLDDGMSFLGCSHSDPVGKIGISWNSFWSKLDFWAGRAGVADNGGKFYTPWDFSKDVAGVEADEKPKNSIISSPGERIKGGKFPMGLTARHRILLASNMHAKYRGQVYKAPVLGLLTFLAPQLADTIRDDWESSRVIRCKQSMAYIRSLIARLVIVYSGDSVVRGPNNWFEVSLKALVGELPQQSLPNYSAAEEDEGLEKLIESKKIVHSHKFAAAWFPPYSPIRKEVGRMSLDPILAELKRASATGFICEEICTASSLTIAGAGGCVAGLSAYRAAVRCGRSFGSESGLKQHIMSSHAPPGTWLCRSCGGDCGTSQARTQHERSCRVPRRVSVTSPLGGDVARCVAEGASKPSRGRKRKEMKFPVMKEVQSAADSKGSTRVSGYKGVWIMASGKYFVKVGGKPLLSDSSEIETTLLFDTAEAAAKKFDEVIIESGRDQVCDINYRSDGSRIIYEDGAHGEVNSTGKDAEGTGISGAVIATPDLSVINIKKLPPHVKPLLRDPNFTSRTGGNSKRYVYAYRGVCRQQRKGHDRWQSQISFNGQNHYLGTFDSEWDAAAVYAWAHLILYGEEATKKAQLEGEEAAAAFAQHEKDIAEGKIQPPSPKIVNKKKRGAPKKIKVEAAKDETTKDEKAKAETAKAKTAKVESAKVEVSTTGGHGRKNHVHKKSEIVVSERKVKAEMAEDSITTQDIIMPEGKCSIMASETLSVHASSKNPRPESAMEWSKLKTQCATMLSSGTKGTSKATILATRKDIADMSEKQLLQNVSGYISGNVLSVPKAFLQTSQRRDMSLKQLATRVSSTKSAEPMRPHHIAMLIGLQASDFGWEMKKFIDTCHGVGVHSSEALPIIINSQFGADGANRSFFAFVLSSSFTLGRACKHSRNKFLPSADINSTFGMPVGDLDCDVGGPDNSCSEMAAKIQYLPSKCGNFQLKVMNDDDIITLNGRRISTTTGPLPLRDRDVCSVGARVFVFVEEIAPHL